MALDDKSSGLLLISRTRSSSLTLADLKPFGNRNDEILLKISTDSIEALARQAEALKQLWSDGTLPAEIDDQIGHLLAKARRASESSGEHRLLSGIISVGATVLSDEIKAFRDLMTVPLPVTKGGTGSNLDFLPDGELIRYNSAGQIFGASDISVPSLGVLNAEADYLLDGVRFISDGVLSEVTITDDGGVDVSWSAGKIYTEAGDVIAFGSGSDSGVDGVNYLYYDETSDSVVLSTSPHDHSEDVSLGRVGVQDGNIWHVHQDPTIRGIVDDIQLGLEEAFPTVVISGLLVSEDTDVDNIHDVESDAGTYYLDLHKRITAPAIQSRVTPLRRWYHSGGSWTQDTNTQVDIANYDNGTNRVALTNNKWAKVLFLISSTEIHLVYPQEQHNTQAQAIAGALPTPPPGLADLARSTAYVLQEGEASMGTAGGDQWLDLRQFVEGAIPGGIVTDHGALAGLSDPDHVQASISDWPLTLANGGTGVDLSGGAIDGELVRMNSGGTALEGSGIASSEDYITLLAVDTKVTF